MTPRNNLLSYECYSWFRGILSQRCSGNISSQDWILNNPLLHIPTQLYKSFSGDLDIDFGYQSALIRRSPPVLPRSHGVAELSFSFYFRPADRCSICVRSLYNPASFSVHPGVTLLRSITNGHLKNVGIIPKGSVLTNLLAVPISQR